MHTVIDHIAYRNGSKPICGNNSGLTSVSFDTWKAQRGTGTYRFCKRCEPKAYRAEAVTAKKEGR